MLVLEYNYFMTSGEADREDAKNDKEFNLLTDL